MSNLESSPCAHVHVHVVSVAGLILGYLEALVCFFLMSLELAWQRSEISVSLSPIPDSPHLLTREPCSPMSPELRTMHWN